MKFWEFFKEIERDKLIFFVSLAIIGLVFLAWGESPKSKTATPELPRSSAQIESEINRQEKELAERLEGILGKIAGVGEVAVEVKLLRSSAKEYALNRNAGQKITNETEKSGISRSINENTDQKEVVLIKDREGQESPVLLTEETPVVGGVVVVAEGAGNPALKEKIIQAVASALAVPLHKIEVLEGESKIVRN
ncbi:stage III sporulation protein AG [Carboxydothermus islandicus]|uniref:Stage III sporulation protein AG n=1 Tax=Carboxydothermus islandicus TaxID=661089 RepID=A0A1L8D393_9THEO|nr:stage III sporulation protein AG [Carboxydothermus islandicus]GAV25666.1 stage III sporulation protein AG [Carboxydothermus islandicus]